MILQEMRKQLIRPFVWVFMGLCIALNLYTLWGRQYTINQIMNEDEYVYKTAASELSGEYPDFARKSDARDIVYSVSCPSSNKYLYTFYPYPSGSAEIHNTVLNISTPVLEERLTLINENHEHLSINGGTSLHDLIFNVLWLVLGETAVFALMISIKCGGFEFSEGTAQVVYSTKKGRALSAAKLFASLILAEIFLIIMLLVSFSVLFSLCPCFNLLSVPFFIYTDYKIIIPWVPLTVMQYLLLSVLFGFVLTALFSLIGYAVWGVTRNIFLACAGSITLCAVMFFGTLALPPIPVLKFFGLSTPVMLLCNLPGYWFALSKRGVPLPWFECISSALWVVILTVFIIFSLRKLRRMKI